MLLILGLSCKITLFTKRATSAARRISHTSAEAKERKEALNEVSVISVRLEIQVSV